MEDVPPSLQLAVATLSIGGMTCSSCSNAIQDGLEKLPTVKSSSISALTNIGKVVFDQTRSTSISEIIQVIEDKGYDCSIQDIESVDTTKSPKLDAASGKRTVQLSVDGMVCESCPSLITNSLTQHFADSLEIKHPFDLRNPILSILYHPEAPTLTIRSIITHIQSLGPLFIAQPYYPPSIEETSRTIQRREHIAILWRLLVAGLVAIPTFYFGIVCMSILPQDNTMREWVESPLWTGNTSRAQWILFFLATPVYFFSASNFHFKAGKELFSLWRSKSTAPILQRFYRFGSMNLLISAGTTVAYFASVALLIVSAVTSSSSNINSTYFDSVVFLTFFILIGRSLESLSKAKAGDAVSMLGRLCPETAFLVVLRGDLDKSNKSSSPVREISTDLLEIGDEVMVPHGSTPPADGYLTWGDSKFDESSLTGESRAIQKKIGDKVFLGTINVGNSIKMSITDIGGSSMLDQIVNVVREGQTKRAPIERIAATITAYFVPIITLLAIITFFVWFGLGQSGILDPRYLDGNDGGWAFWSLEFAIAVFVVACPCGIGLAAPTALYVGTGMAAKAGILVRGGGEAFQDANHLDAIVFDKTGTLTEGNDLEVTDYEMMETGVNVPEAVFWNIARILEENSSHPIAQAIAKTSVKHGEADIEAIDTTEIPGQGMRGTFVISESGEPREFEAVLGSEFFLTSLNPSLLSRSAFVPRLLSTWKTDCKSVAILAIRRKYQDSQWHIAMLFALSDPVRPSAASAIAALQARGIKTYMLSGDNPETARAVALAVGIPVANVFASALPLDKAAQINKLKEDLAHPRHRTGWSSPGSAAAATTIPPKPAKIVFVGDGINDAPALLASTVSISLSSGSPIALTSSSFILLTPSLESIITLLDLSQKVFRRIKWNFAWALVYNVILIPVAAGVLFKTKPDGFILGPVWASAAMALSSLSVILASLAMRWGF
ncbi:MAG: hypothetical protein GOMPHAMPRED_004095 [Gomphillus americanus]|uniref:HMA domain-containing protein n=1 Tax=Gomphillus americanus TaxID=1940652 RepID=A0A8H3FMV8_9LECA|nr:MAG: hypothetical protein GOMPHAMPRED_004095 [Gomphillus americanus]